MGLPGCEDVDAGVAGTEAECDGACGGAIFEGLRWALDPLRSFDYHLFRRNGSKWQPFK